MWRDVILFVAGALTPVFVELARGWVTRTQRRSDRRDDFQRQTLLDVQDALVTLGRLTAEVHQLIRDRKPISNDKDEAHRVASMRVSVLTVRLDDSEARQRIQSFRERVTAITTSNPDDNFEELGEPFIAALDKVNDRIGELVRKH